ncbi:alpha/beta hydrolase family protein [Oxynema aestuarii]|jgi:predicted dienelactone hydrolase|uniref:Chlorophyllase n=1 Tax=Oxynema aestuarii AP17 TaxID=2064643 RepID=A0A6H1TZC1_9CYAN|nr:hypothetical protein [Oxynema aestuarii]QIZ71952.1 hypothetical protein HCG48_16325 [Oxynema aestuarii AP17]
MSRLFALGAIAALAAVSVTLVPHFLANSQPVERPSEPAIAPVAIETPSPVPMQTDRDPSQPLYAKVDRFKTTIPGYNDPADIYYPQPSQLAPADRLPVALLIQGFNVDAAYYSQFATQIARYGFIVVVPNHLTTIRDREELFPQVGQVTDVLRYVKAQQHHANSPLFKITDAEKLVLIGHSQGGFIGLDAIREACDLPWCEGPYERPKELLAGVFFGSDLWEDGEYLKVNNAGIPIALIAGSRDSLIRAESIEKTYNNIESPPKAYIEVRGANHYGLTDLDNPPGSPNEKSSSTLDRAVSLETIARWTAVFLRAYALDDRAALAYLGDRGPREDPNVRVRWQGN